MWSSWSSFVVEIAFLVIVSMYLFGFDAAGIPNPKGGSRRGIEVISMKYGEKLIINYIEAPNETLRDVSDDTEAIVAVLDALEGIHRVFLELLIDLQGSEPLLFSDAGDLCDDIF